MPFSITPQAEQSWQNGPWVMLAVLGSLVLRQADDVNKPLVKFPLVTNVRFRSGPHEQRSLLNAFALENYCRHVVRSRCNKISGWLGTASQASKIINCCVILSTIYIPFQS